MLGRLLHFVKCGSIKYLPKPIVMFKTIILLLNFLLLFAYQTIFEEDIRVEQDFPQYVNAGDTFTVEIQINKSDYLGFAKWQQELPQGFIASKLESQNATFSFKNNTVKLIWLSMPEKESFTISYRVSVAPEMSGVFELSGKYSFIVENERRDIFSTKDQIAVVGKDGIVPKLPEKEELAVKGEHSQNKEIKTDTLNNPTDLAEEKETEEIAQEDKGTASLSSQVTPTDLIKKTTNIPSPEKSIQYKVQIAAGHNNIPGDYFKVKHQIEEKVAIEFHQGWKKYTVGNFGIYQLARDKRNEIWNEKHPIKGAFVTAYNRGERISVQEALMISRQKWFK